MANVVDMMDYNPHWTGEVKCLSCGYKGIAVAPLGTCQLECPDCHTERMVPFYPFADVDVPRFVCNCGCDVFTIYRDGPMCMGCGHKKPWDDV